MNTEKKQYDALAIDFVRTEEQDVITTSPIELPVIPAFFKVREDSFEL